MSIIIKQDSCTGCGACRKVCPGSLLYENEEGKTYIKYPKECWGCTSCLKECEAHAIHYFLGADMGGNGGTMYIKREQDELHWVINSKYGEKTIIINKNQSNKY